MDSTNTETKIAIGQLMTHREIARLLPQDDVIAIGSLKMHYEIAKAHAKGMAEISHHMLFLGEEMGKVLQPIADKNDPKEAELLQPIVDMLDSFQDLMRNSVQDVIASMGGMPVRAKGVDALIHMIQNILGQASADDDDCGDPDCPVHGSQAKEARSFVEKTQPESIRVKSAAAEDCSDPDCQFKGTPHSHTRH